MKKMYLIKISDELYLVKHEAFGEMIKECIELSNIYVNLSKENENQLNLSCLVENMMLRDNEENNFIDIDLLDLNYLLEVIKQTNKTNIIKSLTATILLKGGCVL